MIDDINKNPSDLYYEDLIVIEAKVETAREIALRLLKNLDFNFISKITELSIDEIQGLTKSN